MRKYFLYFIVSAILLSACGKTVAPIPPTVTISPAPTIVPTQAVALPTVTPVCISSQPTQADVDRALSYTGDAFSAPEWERSYAATETAVAVTWQNASLSALVYLEARIKPCGYEEPDLNKEFSGDNWKSLFANYESYQPIAECRSDAGLRLYQFKAQTQGSEYAINYWAQSDTNTRVVATMIVFPLAEQSLLGTYSAQLFPNLPNCS